MKHYRLEWLHEGTKEWRGQHKNDDKNAFTAAVAEIMRTSKREGDWMKGTKWRIAEYELTLISTLDIAPEPAPCPSFL